MVKNMWVKCKTCKNRFRRDEVNKIQNALLCTKCQPDLFSIKPPTEPVTTEVQKSNLVLKKENYEKANKTDRKYTMEEIVLFFLADKPDDWFFTWELMGATKWGWLSHATHATLRRAEQKGLIIKDYVGQYVVYTHKQ